MGDYCIYLDEISQGQGITIEVTSDEDGFEEEYTGSIEDAKVRYSRFNGKEAVQVLKVDGITHDGEPAMAKLNTYKSTRKYGSGLNLYRGTTLIKRNAGCKFRLHDS